MPKQTNQSRATSSGFRSFVESALVGILLTTIVYLGVHVYVNRGVSSWQWLIPPVGLLLSLLLGIGVQAILACRAQREAAAQDRTAELTVANRELQQEIAERKRAEDALNLEKRFSDAVIDSLPGIFYLLDENGLMVRWNANFEKVTGYSAKEIAGANCITFVADEGKDRVAERVATAYRDGGADAETNLLSKTGERMPYFLSGAGKVIGDKVYLVGMGIDIGNRKRLEEELRASERGLRRFAENVSDLIWVMDFNGHFTYFSPSIQQLLGYTPEEGVQLTIADMFTPPSLALASRALQESYAEIMAGQPVGPRSFELEHVRKDGSTVWTEAICTTMRDESGQVVAVQGVTRDISERKRLEEALRKSERLYRLLAENVGEVIWAMDFTGRYIYFSPSIEQLVGYTAEEGVKMCLDNLLAPASLSLAHGMMKELIPAVMAGQHVGPLNLEIEHLHKNGSSVWCDVTLATMVDESGQVIAIQGVTRNITERRQMEHELRNAKEAAEAATRAKSRFLAVMSHEIRTPMTAILGYSDLLMDPQLDPASRHDYLTTVRRSGEHLLLLIDDILDLLKIEAGKLTLDIRGCSVAELLADVASMMRPRAEQRGNTLDVEYTTEIPETIRTDPARLRQALVNLAGNAVKFTEKGRVRLHAAFLPQWRDNQPAIAIKVTDTGIGIAEDAMTRLFQPFSQADLRVSAKYGGTGLGLAISRQIIEMLGGELSAASEFGCGSTFTLTVPTGDLSDVKMLQRPAEASVESVPRRETIIGKNLLGVRVLLAEDGFDNQRLISTVLRRAGAEVKIAENGRIAVAMAEAEPFDVLLMDMNMPEMDGDVATRLLRSRNYQRPILAITAATMTEDVARSLAAGCDDHLAKPIDLSEMIEAVEWFAKRDSTDETPSTAGNNEIAKVASAK